MLVRSRCIRSYSLLVAQLYRLHDRSGRISEITRVLIQAQARRTWLVSEEAAYTSLRSARIFVIASSLDNGF